MKSYLLTPDAQRDLNGIVHFIADHSPSNALKIFDKLHAAARRLAKFPGIGHRRDDLADETLRIWPVHAFLIIYRPTTNPLQIIRILHGAQDIAKKFGGKI